MSAEAERALEVSTRGQSTVQAPFRRRRQQARARTTRIISLLDSFKYLIAPDLICELIKMHPVGSEVLTQETVG